MIPEIASIAVVHDEVESLFILEGVDHVYQKRVFELFKESFFIHD